MFSCLIRAPADVEERADLLFEEVKSVPKRRRLGHAYVFGATVFVCLGGKRGHRGAVGVGEGTQKCGS